MHQSFGLQPLFSSNKQDAHTEDAEVTLRARGSFFASSPLFRRPPASNLMARKEAIKGSLKWEAGGREAERGWSARRSKGGCAFCFLVLPPPPPQHPASEFDWPRACWRSRGRPAFLCWGWTVPEKGEAVKFYLNFYNWCLANIFAKFRDAILDI